MGPPDAVRILDGRYQVMGQLGAGGTATVYAVRELAGGERLALKRLRMPSAPDRRTRALALFEREYLTLAGIPHPGVVTVYDYGLDDGVPYYTMELLDGGDLGDAAPVPWRAACAMMRDVCSVLSFVHGRHVLHRDISPGNVRCTADGRAKLLDFGAMVPMGPARRVVGTPPICSPEIVHYGTLDARSDLYSVGCTLYFALTGRHAYPARDFDHLSQLWSSEALRPSAWVTELPAALDALVMQLLLHDPAGRPGSAAEVMEHLGAIADLPRDEALPVSHSYLAAPELVAREPAVARIRRQVTQAVQHGRGGAVLITGASGSGRSRVLDAALLEAKLAGAVTARAEASGGDSGRALLHTLTRAVLRQRPELARGAALPHREALLGPLPWLFEQDATDRPAAAAPSRPALQQALADWFSAVSHGAPLVLGVDDVDCADDLSAAFTALLADRAASLPLLVVATAETHAADTAPGPMALLARTAVRVELEALTVQDAQTLLRAVFGQVPHLPRLAQRLWQRADGNPRDLMSLARDLVTRDVVHYEAGSWVIPAALDDRQLPGNMQEALQQRVRALPPRALHLGQAVALLPERSLDLPQLMALSGELNATDFLRAADALLEAGILRGNERGLSLSRRDWSAPLLAACEAPALRALHLRLAEFHAERGDRFRRAQHLLRGGALEAGLDALIEYTRHSLTATAGAPEAFLTLEAALPDDYHDTFQHGLRLCAQLGRPALDAHVLRDRMTGLLVGGFGDTEGVRTLVAELVIASGLDLYQGLPDDMPPTERLGASLKAAQARYDATPPALRLQPPLQALRPLARACNQAIGCVASRLDLPLWEAIPSLAPFEPLSPAIGIVDLLIEGLGHRLKGRRGHALRTYAALLARAEQPDRAGIEPTMHRYLTTGVHYGMGLLELGLGSERALLHAEAIEAEPSHQVNALRLRMLHHLWRGEQAAAADCRRHAELLQVRRGAKQWFEGGHLMAELSVHAACDDVGALKQTLADVSVMARALPGWVPVLHYGRGAYQRVRGAREDALAELDAALALAPAGRHQLHCEIAGARLRVLNLLRRHAQAAAEGEAQLAAALDAQQAQGLHFIRMPLALAQAATGEHGRAAGHLQDTTADLEALGAGAVLWGMAEETAARLAALAGDAGAFERHADACAGHYLGGGHRALVARHARLLEIGRECGVVSSDASGRAAASAAAHGELATALLTVADPTAWAERALQLLMAKAGVAGGALFRLQAGQLVAAALSCSTGEFIRAEVVAEQALRRELDDAEFQTVTGTDASCATTAGHGLDSVRPPARSAQDLWVPGIIGHSVRGEFRLTGIIVYLARPGQRFRLPTDLASQLSRYWQDSTASASATGGDGAGACGAPRDQAAGVQTRRGRRGGAH